MRVMIVLTMLAGLAGAICLGIATRSPTYVNETGMLIEPFALMASARILLLLFGIGVITSLSICIFRRIHRLLSSGTPRPI